MVTHLSNRVAPRPPRPRGGALLRTPFVILAAVLVILGAGIWATALGGDDAATDAAACNASPEAEAAGLSPQKANALDDVQPATLDKTRIRVLNANGESGQAGAIAAQLSERGFRAAGQNATGNDPVYPGQDLGCHGQIRYGDKGAGTARSLSLVAPCMELVSDPRSDDTVDLVLGKIFSKLSDSTRAYSALDELKAGRQPSDADLEAARAGNC